MEHRDYPLGSTFEHEGTMLIVVDDSDGKCCDACYFFNKGTACRYLNCMSSYCREHNEVRFEELSEQSLTT